MNKIIGLDLGSKTLGIAMSDLLQMYAHGVETFRFPENQYDVAIKYLSKLINTHQVKTVVLGLPKHMNGDVGIRGQISFDFKMKIEEKNPVEVVLIDERLTSMMMEKSLIKNDVKRKKRKEVIDKMAAVVILQSYLDSLKR